MDSQQVVARFELERQALAMMDHPNIARVFDAGSTDGGYPFFVMEWVDGVPVTNFCRECDLDLDARLRLFATICRAVDRAHEKSVVHRDLKPANILVSVQDGNPVPKVIDFGIAKALLSEAANSAGDAPAAMGQPITLQKRSFRGRRSITGPEHASGRKCLEIDRRSDVYSLGALLYELLTDVPPFDPREFNSYREIDWVICRGQDPGACQARRQESMGAPSREAASRGA